MTEDLIGYAELIDKAMRGVVRDTLHIISDTGLPEEHHCYITFYTNMPGVDISPKLQEQYPEEMTIVLQHQFWDLRVEEDYFEVTLSFNRKKEPLHIPFSALTAFADPSIKFGLQFQREPGFFDDEDEEELTAREAARQSSRTPPSSMDGAEIISLDTFRKKD